MPRYFQIYPNRSGHRKMERYATKEKLEDRRMERYNIRELER